MSCIFCDIAEKKIPSNIVFESDSILAFQDVNPQAPVHFLIIPREHIATLNHLDEQHTAVIADMVQVARRLAAEKKIDDSGYRLVMNCNDDGGQTVHHIHLHLLGGRALGWPPG